MMNSYLQSKNKGMEVMSAAFRLEAVPISQDDVLMELPLNGTHDTHFYFEILCLATRDDKALCKVRRDIYIIIHMWSENTWKNKAMLADRANKIQGFLEKHNYRVSPISAETLDAIYRQTMQNGYHAMARPSTVDQADNSSTGLIQNMAENMEAGSSLSVIIAKSKAKVVVKSTGDTNPAREKEPQDIYRVAAFLTADKRESLAKAGLSLPNWQEYGIRSSLQTPRIHLILYSMRDFIQQDRLYPRLNLKQTDYLRRMPSGNKTPFPNSIPTPIINNIDSQLLLKGNDGRKIGTLLGLRQPQDIFLQLDHLSTHTAILGTSGSGKTSMLMNFMYECYKTGGINYLCLDVEGYDLKRIAPSTNADIYTVGRNTASPYPINPFIIKGLEVEETCELLKELLTNALEGLWHPLPQFIVDALKAMYHPDFSYERNNNVFLTLFEKVFDSENNYGSDQQKMKAPGIARLRRLEELQGGASPFNAVELLDRNTVIELGRMALDNRLFVLCFILKTVATIQKKRHAAQCKGKPLLIVIDEAHVVLQNNHDEDNKAANYLISLINSIIKEGRKYGLYILLSDQSPKILHDILPNVKCKIVMKEEEDTKELAGLLRSEYAELRLPVMKTGWAYLRVGDMDGSLLIKAPQPLRLDELNDAAVTKYMRQRERLKTFSSLDVRINHFHDVYVETNETAKIKEIANWMVDTVLYCYAKSDANNIETWFSLEKLINKKFKEYAYLLPKVADYLKKKYEKYEILSFIYKI